MSDAVEIPGLRLDVTANSRLHWAARAAKVKRQRTVVGLMLRSVDRPTLPTGRVETRVTPVARPHGAAAGDGGAVARGARR